MKFLNSNTQYLMKKLRFILICIIFFFFSISLLQAQGDDCASAVEIITNGLYTANGPSTGGGATNIDATNADWYYFVATDNGTIDVSACDLSSIDTRLYIYDGTCGTLNELGTSDDECTTFQWASFLAGISVTNGVTYYIEWDDRWSTDGFDFTFTFTPFGTCPSPINLSASNISDVSADLGWTEQGTATTCNIEYGPVGFTQGTGTMINGSITNPHSVTGLSASTSYDFYVQSDCGGGDLSFWVGPFTFSTICNTIPAPYTEDFENGGIIPICWVNDVGDFFDWEFNTATPSPNTGPQSGDHTSGSGYFAFTEATNPNNPNQQADLLTPWIDISTLTTPMLTFWYNMYGADMGDLHIDINDGTWQNDVLVLSGNNGDIWTESNIILSTYSSPVQVRFRGITGTDYSSDMAIDDVSFIEAPTCPDPINLDVLSITANSANLSWTEVGSATTWNIEYGLQGFPLGGGVTINGVTSNPYLLSGLMPSVTYDYYVQSDCGGGDYSSWIGPFTFTTACNTYTAPYFEDFENAGSIPICWINNTGDDFDWEFNTTTASAGTGPSGDHTTGIGYFALTEASNPNNPNKQADMLSPWVDVSTLTMPGLIFWYNMNGATMGDLHIDINDGTWHNDVLILSGDQGDVWIEVSLNLSAYTSPVQARFRGITGTDYLSDMAIDDVSFDEMPTCPSPASLSATNITDISADLAWTETGSATIWNVEYGSAGFVLGSGTLLTGITSNPYTLIGLTGLTDYEFYLMSDCGSGDTSNWVGPSTFTTLTTPLSNPSPCEVGIAIPDANCVAQPIEVIAPGVQLGTDIYLSDINIIIEHPSSMDLSFTLESPNGVLIDISMNNGGWGDPDYGIIDGTCTQYTNFNMAGVDGDITAGTAPFLGSFIPQGDFNDFNDDSNPNGLWTIQLCDQWNGNVGTLEYIELVFEQILPPVDMIINEIDCDQATDTSEFIEIYDGGLGNYPLDAFVVVLYNGSSDQCYQAFDLDGYSTDVNGYFVLGNATVPNVGLVFADGLLQNGADAVALYEDDATTFPIGTPITITNLEDALTYETNDATDIQLLALLNGGQPQINEDNLGDKDNHSCSRLPNGSGGQRNTFTYNAAMPTPGAINNAVPELVWNNNTFVEALTNDGSIQTIIDIELNDNDFATIGVLVESTDYTVANVPIGLSVVITITSDTTVNIELTGNAGSHLDVDDISNMEITFLDNAYATWNAMFVIGNFNLGLIVDFFDLPPPTLTWDATIFNEDVADDGSIASVINLILTSETFAVLPGLMTESTHYTVANVPTGLIVEINVIDTINATVELSGNAVSHDNIDDINNMKITFLDTSFTTNLAIDVDNYSQPNLSVDFIQYYNDSTDIISYSFVEQTGPAIIDPVWHTVYIEVLFGTDISNLVATYTLSTGATATIATILQISAVTANDFALPVIYNVLAEDTITNQDWTINVSVATEINNVNVKNYEISIFPNPADDKFVLKILSGSDNNYQINLINVHGQILLNQNYSNQSNIYKEFDVSKLSSGIYYLKINNEHTISIKKIIIQ